MTVADLARAVAEQNAFEAKKDAVRQVQSGDWRLTLTVKAGDLPTSVMTAAPGARYVVALVPIDDDEMPLGGEDNPVAADGDAVPPTAAPARRRWSELSRAQRAGMLCEDVEFQNWVGERFYGSAGDTDAIGAAVAVRSECQVASRSQLDHPSKAPAWDALETAFLQATGRMAVSR